MTSDFTRPPGGSHAALDSARGPRTPTADTPAMVLLVDDQTIVAEAIRRALVDEEGIDFHYCPRSDDALAVAIDTRPTVILQDLVMPGADGLSLVSAYRANPATRDVPIIVLSTQEDPAIKSTAFACGANDYLVKLPDRIELVARPIARCGSRSSNCSRPIWNCGASRTRTASPGCRTAATSTNIWPPNGAAARASAASCRC